MAEKSYIPLFFGPIKLAPFFRYELTDDIDHYPEAYLERMASDGINGIGLTVVEKELAENGFFPADPFHREKSPVADYTWLSWMNSRFFSGKQPGKLILY